MNYGEVPLGVECAFPADLTARGHRLRPARRWRWLGRLLAAAAAL